MKSMWFVSAASLVASMAAVPSARAQATAPPATTAPTTVPVHWSKNPYPTSVPEGSSLYIVQRGDTLWDLARRFHGNPYLWPQIWDQNRYITDAHWIYPGDPILVPAVAVVATGAGEPSTMATEGQPDAAAAGSPASPTAGGEGAGAGAGEGSGLALSEPDTVRCAPYIVSAPEDETLQILGSEHGNSRISFADREIIYLDRGSLGGVKAGDVFTLHHRLYDVRHPMTRQKLGHKVEVTGWARVILALDQSSTAVVEHACDEIHPGDYLQPFAAATVPRAASFEPSQRLTPPTGKTQGYIVDMAANSSIAGAGQLVLIDLGSQSGIAPGAILTIFRVVYPTVPTARRVLGDVAVLSVRDGTATATVLASHDAIMVGDQVELR